MKDEQSAGVILFTNNTIKRQFLILHYPMGHWDFVKGKIELGETIKQTVHRETKEETGIEDLEFIDDFKSEIRYNFQFEGELIRKKVIFFLAKTKTKDVIISDEHLDYVWLSFQNALKKITFQNSRDILLKAENLLCKKI